MTGTEGKNVAESSLIRPYQVSDSDLNKIGALYGGRLLAIMDSIAARVAHAHSGMVCVTASVDSVNFLAPVLVDETLLIKVSVNRTWNTSMEIGVRVEITRQEETIHVASAYLTFVALNEDGKPTKIIPVIAQTDEEQRRFAQAGERRQVRLANRHRKN